MPRWSSSLQEALNVFVNKHCDRYGVESICRVIQAAPFGYYLLLAKVRQPELRSTRAKQDEWLNAEIQLDCSNLLRASDLTTSSHGKAGCMWHLPLMFLLVHVMPH